MIFVLILKGPINSLFPYALDLIFGLGFFLWEQSLLRPDLSTPMVPFLEGAPEALQDLARAGGAYQTKRAIEPLPGCPA